MKRTNLMLDEELLKTATRILGAKTYSAAVNRALEDAVRTARIRGLSEFFGKDVWSGDLSEMREDRGVPTRRKKK